MRKTFAVLTLALLTVLALPLSADVPTEPVPAVDVEIAESVDTVQTDVTPEAAGFDLEAVMDDGRIELSCNLLACFDACTERYGLGAIPYCDDWNGCQCIL